MRGRLAFAVAVVATVVLCVRAESSAKGFLWMVIHGVGPAALIAFVPLGILLALLWGGFRYVNRSSHRQALFIFTGFAAGLVLVNEAPWPGTQANRARHQRAMDAIEVQSIHDEELLSAKGNPIGIRVTYELRSPQRVVASVYLGLNWYRSDVGPMLEAAEFSGPPDTIDPESSRGIYKVLQSGGVYKLTARLTPGFLVYDEKTQQPCFRVPPSGRYSEADVAAAISERRPRKYDMNVSLTSEGDNAVGYHARYMTSREYDLAVMYQTILREGHKRCSF